MFQIHFHLFQFLFAILTIISIGIMVRRHRKNQATTPTLVLWTIVWIVLMIFSCMPQLADRVAYHLGMGAGANLIFIVAIVGCFYLIFHLYDKVDKQEQNINKLVKELALKNEISIEKEEENKK